MTYDLRTLALPRAGGASLRALVALLETAGVRDLVLSRLRRDAGVDRLRTEALAEPPTFYPHHRNEDAGIPALVPHDGNDSPYLDQPAEPPEPPGFPFPSVADYQAGYRGGLSPEAVAERFLAQWRASDSGDRPIRAFIAVRPDDLATQAAASAARWRAGNPIGPWDGVPVAIKDEVDVSGYPTTLGTRILGRAAAATDATVVARLRAAGALVVGKANMHEIGINVTGLNPHHGTPRNPYDDTRHTGGSSSGSAAAVACGLVPVAIGADGGGSIRIPSACCGLVGLKPTFGRVSEAGAPPLVWSVAHLGPIAARVRDCAAAYALVAGDDAADRNTRGHPSVSVDVAPPGSLSGVRIGVFRPWSRHAAADIASRFEALLETVAACGATVVDVEIPELDLQRVAHAAVILSEMASAMAPHHPARRTEFGLETRVSLTLGRSFSGAELMAAARVRTRAMAHWRHAFRDVHAILTPATAEVAAPIVPGTLASGRADFAHTTAMMRFVFPPNLTGHPAISFPAGYDGAGLPIGAQAIGRPWSERLLLRIAAMAELHVERRPPKRWYPTLDPH